MAAVAQRLMLRTFTGAEPDLLVTLRLPFLRPEFGAFVRSVAKRLRPRAPAGAPPVAFAGNNVDRNRPPAADFRFIAHENLPASLMRSYRRLPLPATPRRTLSRVRVRAECNSAAQSRKSRRARRAD